MVAVTRRVTDSTRRSLESRFDVVIHDSLEQLEHARLLRFVKGASGILSTLRDRIDAGVLDAAGPQLRVVANHAAGYDNVDLDECATRGVVVTNTPGVLTHATAEFTLALVLTLLRRVVEGDGLVRRGEPWDWAPTFMLGESLRGKTVGIVGRGRIGGEFAALANALGADVLHASRTGGIPIGELLRASHVVSIHCPLTAETRHLIGRAELEALGPGGYLVNTSRGAIVDESALADALEGGVIRGAALDVYEREPAVEPRLLALPNVVLAPHLGSATEGARDAMGALCVESLDAVLLRGTAPRLQVQ